MCELADVSVGDAWLPELRGRGDWNLTVIRTSAGGEAIDRPIAAGRLRAEPTTPDQISQAQRVQLYQRERGAWARMRLLQRLGRSVPAYRGPKSMPLRRGDFTRTISVGAAQLIAQLLWMQGWMVPLANLGRRLSRGRSAAKDALVGRDRAYAEEFFKGDEYRF